MQWFTSSIALFVLFSGISDTNSFSELSGVRVDTASAIKDFENGRIVIKANTNVTVRLFGTRLQQLKNVRVIRSVESCAIGDAAGTVSSEQLLETSPPTAALNFRFPDYSTVYYFCFEWTQPSAEALYRARSAGTTTGTKPPLLERMSREPLSDGTFEHQGTDSFRSIATAQRSWFG